MTISDLNDAELNIFINSSMDALKALKKSIGQKVRDLNRAVNVPEPNAAAVAWIEASNNDIIAAARYVVEEITPQSIRNQSEPAE